MRWRATYAPTRQGSESIGSADSGVHTYCNASRGRMACRASRQTRHVTISFACKKLHNNLSVARHSCSSSASATGEGGCNVACRNVHTHAGTTWYSNEQRLARLNRQPARCHTLYSLKWEGGRERRAHLHTSPLMDRKRGSRRKGHAGEPQGLTQRVHVASQSQPADPLAGVPTHIVYLGA